MPVNDPYDITDSPDDHEGHQDGQGSYPYANDLVQGVHQSVLARLNGQPFVVLFSCHGPILLSLFRNFLQLIRSTSAQLISLSPAVLHDSTR